MPSCTNCVVGNISVVSPSGGTGFDRYSNHLFVSNWSMAGGLSNLTVIDVSTNRAITTLLTQYEPVGVTYAESNGDVYVSGGGSGIVDVFNGSTDKLATQINVLNSIGPGNPMGSAYDPANRTVYIETQGINNPAYASLCVVNTSKNSVVANVPLGVWFTTLPNQSAQQVTVDPKAGEVFASAYLGVSIVNTTTDKVVSRLNYTSAPMGGAYDSRNGDVYIAVPLVPGGGSGWTHRGNVSVIDPATNRVVTNISVGDYPVGVVYDPTNDDLYVTNQGSNNVSVINGSTNKVLGSIPVRTTPGFGTYVPSNGDVYVGDQQANDLSVISPSGARPVTLSSVAVSPSSASVTTNQSAAFTTTPTCSGGPCPSGVTYSWTMTQGLGSLNSSTGNPVTFTAGSTAGNLSLFVNASLNGITKQAGPIAITITKSSLPTLASVAVSPPSASVLVNGSQVFSAAPTCTGGPCPASIVYAWSVKNAVGSLNATSGPSVTFTGGTSAGNDTLFLNASLNGVTKPATPVQVAVNATSSSTLTGVAVSPPSPAVVVNGTQGFVATPTCTSTCPAGVTYTWSLNITLGSVSPSTGATTTFTAGPAPGSVLLTVKAFLNGVTKWSNATITITAAVGVLSSVSISPTSITVGVGNSTSFTAHPNCTGGSCPSGATYSWSLNNTALGTISPTTGPTETFTAGTTTGSVLLYATASLNGVHQTGLAIINITKGPVPTITGLALTHSPSVTVQAGKMVDFSTTATCNVSQCPTGITYNWVLNNALGNLSSASSSSATFIAGPTAGLVFLTVTATLNGGTQQATSTITISSSPVPTLSGVSISPGAVTVSAGKVQDFTGAPACSPGPCPASVVYTWKVNNTLGSLNTTAGSKVTLTAGTSAGALNLTVSASYNGNTVNSSVVVTVTATHSPSPGNNTAPPTFLGLPGYEGFVLFGVVLALIMAATIVALSSRGRRNSAPPPAAAQGKA